VLYGYMHDLYMYSNGSAQPACIYYGTIYKPEAKNYPVSRDVYFYAYVSRLSYH
jgi:hypothetical protein